MAESIEELTNKIKAYEKNGPAKLYYALNRKMNEMGDLLNKTNLTNINLEDKESKSFDRLFKLLEKSQVISNAAQAVKGFAGITGDEEMDVNKKPFIETIVQDRV
jgi:translation initiation factor 2B subunit (eIF-2B alpha/beta/delta family)